MTRSSAIGIGLIALGAGALGVGLAFALRRRKSNLSDSSSGLPLINTTRRGNKVVKHYRASKLPIEKRIALIQDHVYESVQDPEIRHLALAITGHGTRRVRVGSRELTVNGAGCPARDGLCETRAIDAWLRDPRNLRYTGDVAPIKLGAHGPVEPVDFFSSAKRAVEYGGEDCDGHAIVGSSLLALNGVTPRLRVTSPSLLGAGWSHIYVVAGLPKERPAQWIALDSTLPTSVCPGGECFGHEVGYAKKRDFLPYVKEIPA